MPKLKSNRHKLPAVHGTSLFHQLKVTSNPKTHTVTVILSNIIIELGYMEALNWANVLERAAQRIAPPDDLTKVRDTIHGAH